MRSNVLNSVSAAALAALVCVAMPAHAQTKQTKMSEWTAVASRELNMHPDYAVSLAKSAYVWAYPMINMINRRNVFAQVPAPGKVFGVLPGRTNGLVRAP